MFKVYLEITGWSFFFNEVSDIWFDQLLVMLHLCEARWWCRVCTKLKWLYAFSRFEVKQHCIWAVRIPLTNNSSETNNPIMTWCSCNERKKRTRQPFPFKCWMAETLWWGCVWGKEGKVIQIKSVPNWTYGFIVIMSKKWGSGFNSILNI